MPEQTKKQKYYYSEFADATKKHWTCAPFGGWTDPMGPLTCRYAVFLRMSDTLYIPEYTVERETRVILDQMDAEMQQKAKEESEQQP